MYRILQGAKVIILVVVITTTNQLQVTFPNNIKFCSNCYKNLLNIEKTTRQIQLML